MEIIKLEINRILEILFLIIISIILLWAGLGNVWNHKISHDYPVGYLASDAFQHQTRAESIKDAGNYRNEAFYIAKGFRDVIGYYPPVLYHAGDMFSILSGLEIYDGVFLFLFLFTILGMLIMYFIIKTFNKNAAILAMPLTIFIFATNTSIAFTWGHWPAVLGNVFLIGALWSLAKLDSRWGFVFFGIFTAGVMMTHTSETVFLFLFLFLYLMAKLLLKNFNLKELIEIGKGTVLALVISCYYLIIFRFTWMVAQPYSFSVSPTWVANPGFYLAKLWNFELFNTVSGDHFPLLFLIFILIGLVIAILSFIKTRSIVPAIGIGMLILGFTNYIGFDWRAFQLRFFWPVYLSVLFGIGLYYLIKLVVKKFNILISLSISLLILILIVLNSNFLPANTSMMDPYHWDALMWLSKNSEENAKLYFLYGDIYFQDALLRNSKREHYLVGRDDYINALNNNTIKRYYMTKLPGDGGTMLPYRKGFFSFGYFAKDYNSDYFFGPRDLCSFNYYIFDKYVSSNKELVSNQYNLEIREKMLNLGMQEVHSNQFVSILKNPKPGEDCIGA